MDMGGGRPGRCDRYFPDDGVLFGLYGEAQFELQNLALFHRAAFATVKQMDDALDAMVRDSPPPVHGPDYNDEDQLEWALLMESRRHLVVHDGDSQIAAITGYADELCIIGLWAHAEKFLGEGLAHFTSAPTVYRWDGLLAAYRTAGLDLETLPGFLSADECRRVNNALKHGGKVTHGLAELNDFRGQQGERLRQIDLDVQRYLLGVHHLVGATLERCSQLLSGVDNQKPYRTDAYGLPR